MISGCTKVQSYVPDYSIRGMDGVWERGVYEYFDPITCDTLPDCPDIVNMEVTPFYAASNLLKIKSIWIGTVTDCIIENKWDDWYDSEIMTKKSGKIIKEYIYFLLK